MRRVLVTGGGTGIGRAIARGFAEAGDLVTICGRRLEPLQDTATGYEMAIRQADVTDEARCPLNTTSVQVRRWRLEGDPLFR